MCWATSSSSTPSPAPNLGGGGGDGPARLRIVGRHRHFINAFGENLIVEHIENAVAEASREPAPMVGEFTAAPVYPGEPPARGWNSRSRSNGLRARPGDARSLPRCV
jgi:hypothetical protein